MFGYDENDTRYGNEIPMSEKSAVLKEALDSILNEAEEMGVMDELLEAFNSEETYYADDALNEAVSFSSRGAVVAKTKAQWRNWFRSRAAIAYAKANNDPMYKKLVKASRMRKNMIAAINKKYASKANQRSKQLMKGAKATSNVFKHASVTHSHK